MSLPQTHSSLNRQLAGITKMIFVDLKGTSHHNGRFHVGHASTAPNPLAERTNCAGTVSMDCDAEPH